MPFTKTHQVPKEFFNFFLSKATKKPISGDNRQHPMLPIELHTGGTEDFMVRYYKKGGESSAEDVREFYPCFVIQDFQPEIDKRRLWGRDYIDGIYDDVNKTTEKIILPIPFMYKFQVSVVAKRKREIDSANDWFMQNFSLHRPDCFTFNSFDTDEGKVGDIVPYRIEFTEIPREDRRFEYAYDFTLDTTIHARAKTYTASEEDGEFNGFVGGNFEDALEKIKLTLKVGDLTGLKEVVYQNFEVE